MFIADFHIHSKYSRATSRECVPEHLELWARKKGLDLIGTGDFTHPAWREELKEKLVPSEEGLYMLRKEFRRGDDIAGPDFNPRFIVTGEISSIYKKNGKVRKVHNLILLPGLEDAEALSRRLEAIGNLHSDGRPILGLDSRDLLQITLDVCPEAIFIPAHIWTPHFSLFGAYSGFDDITECFEDLTDHIYALETGLSSDPPMNWRLSALDRFTLVSNSDAHSPANLAREANLFDTVLSYPHIVRALQNRDAGGFYGTIEFFPEEGKYHCDGHRNCKVCFTPSETKAASGICPVCGGRITVGVLHRVEALADRSEGFISPGAKHFESLVPLYEVIASSMGLTTASVKVKEKHDNLIHNLGPELFILRQAPLEDIKHKAGALVAEGIRRLRCGKVEILPGYDGEYGKIKILDKNEIDLFFGQMSFFSEKKKEAPPDPKIVQNKTRRAGPVPDQDIRRGNGMEEVAREVSGMERVTREVSEDIPYGLNREQWNAVSASEPAVTVIAGPGTGKTKTLVSRAVYLIEKCGVPPSEITAVTFTNKAAAEMRRRLEKHFGNSRAVKAMTIGTFHSIALKILSERSGENGVTVIDEINALFIVEDILKRLGLKISPRDVLRGISLIKNGASTLPASGKTPDAPQEVYDLYCTQLERYGVLDYDDILVKALGLFEEKDAGHMDDKHLSGAFSHLLVDEFQDINDIQYRMIREWSKNCKSIFAIGDPDQSIYGFRGSTPRYFEQFQKDFSNIRQVRLTRNYRSTPEILHSAKSVISKGSASGEHGLPLNASREGGARVRLLTADSDFSEALFVAKEINRLVGGIDMLDVHASPAAGRKRIASKQLMGFSDIAVLYRVNRQAEILEQCLLKEGIPYTVAGRNELLANEEVRKTTAFFRFLLNPGDLMSLGVCLKTLGACQGDDVQRILGSYAEAEKSMSSLAGMLETPCPLTAPDSLHRFMELLRKYEPLIRREKPQKLIESFINDNGLPESGPLELLLSTAVLHDGMPAFLQNLILGTEADVVRSGGKVYHPDAVSLMTLHGAKGLEFPIVFLCGLNEGLLPFRSRSGDCDLNEERRLFYVGMTRAQDELILLTSPSPSSFLSDISKESLEEDTLARRQAPEARQLSLFDSIR